jgi:predicted histidine transporter YuiF (NhaC family)
MEVKTKNSVKLIIGTLVVFGLGASLSLLPAIAAQKLVKERQTDLKHL